MRSCAGCHAAIGKRVAAHSHHGERSAGSSCVECRMPRTVFSIKAEIRDHSMSIPIPENTIRHAIPNACNGCHKDRDAQWSVQQMNRWYGSASRQKLMLRADAFAMARAGDAAAVPKLLEILGKPSEGALVRSNAAGHLSRFSNDSRVFAALQGALTDPEPAVRVVAALRLNPGAAERQAFVAALTRALSDSSAIVRMAAAVGLVGQGLGQLPGPDGARLDRAKQLFRDYLLDNNRRIGHTISCGGPR
jgi:hypothetical protein